MSLAEIILAVLVLMFGSGGIWAWSKIRSETVDNWADIATKLRDQLAKMDDELSIQRRRRYDLEEEVKTLQHRVDKLEWFILEYTDFDPKDINGPTEEIL